MILFKKNKIIYIIKYVFYTFIKNILYSIINISYIKINKNNDDIF